MPRTVLTALCALAARFRPAGCALPSPPSQQHRPGRGDRLLRIASWSAKKRKFAGAQDAIWAHGVVAAVHQVSAAPKSGHHVGDLAHGLGRRRRHAGDLPASRSTSGTKFQTPITDISDQCDGKGGNGRFYFAYIDAPDHALIELNTTAAGVTYFGHVHLLSDDPIAAGEWYLKEFGLRFRGATAPSRRTALPLRPADRAGGVADDGRGQRHHLSGGECERGFSRRLDRIARNWNRARATRSTTSAFAWRICAATLDRLRRDGVKVTAEPRAGLRREGHASPSSKDPTGSGSKCWKSKRAANSARDILNQAKTLRGEHSCRDCFSPVWHSRRQR